MTGFEVFTDRGRNVDRRPLATVDRRALRINVAGRELLEAVTSVEVLWDRDTGAWALRPSDSPVTAYQVTRTGRWICTVSCSAFIREAGLSIGSRWQLTPDEIKTGCKVLRAVRAW